MIRFLSNKRSKKKILYKVLQIKIWLKISGYMEEYCSKLFIRLGTRKRNRNI